LEITIFLASKISFLSNLIYNCVILTPGIDRESIDIPSNKKNKTAKRIEQMKSKYVVILLNIIEVFLVASIAVLFYLTQPLYSTKVIFIPKGSTASIISYLGKSGYEMNALDSIIVRTFGYPQSGWIDLKEEEMSKGDFLHKLTISKAALKTVTLIPGETSYFFLDQLATKLNLSKEKLQSSYNKFSYKTDGNILAETYNLPLGMDEEHLMFYLINYTNKKYQEFSTKIFGEYNKKKWYYYITIASIIQKEAANNKEMPLVSSVIHNRLKKGMKLQMDGTLNYGKYSHTKVTSKKIRTDESSYNTYKNRGIPSNPVCAVSLNAIKHAIFPAKTKFLYFVKDNVTKSHIFSENYKTHLKNIKKNRKKKRVKRKRKSTKKVTYKKALTTQEKSVFKKKPTARKAKSVKSLWNNVK